MSQQINQDALKQPQIPDDTFIINETSSVFSISGRQILQLEYTLSKENMICTIAVGLDDFVFTPLLSLIIIVYRLLIMYPIKQSAENKPCSNCSGHLQVVYNILSSMQAVMRWIILQ